MRFTRRPPVRIALRALMTSLLLPMLLVAATTPTWETALPDKVDPKSVQLLELRILACIQTCMKRGCATVVHQDQKCQLVRGDGSPAPSAALLRLLKPLIDVARGKPVRASSIADPQMSPSFVTDGDMGTDFRTAVEDYPFVVVDLGTPYDIEKVFLTNLQMSYFNNFELRLGMEDLPGPDFSSYTLVLDRTSGAQGADIFYRFLNKPVRAKFVSLQLMKMEVDLYISVLSAHGR